MSRCRAAPPTTTTGSTARRTWCGDSTAPRWRSIATTACRTGRSSSPSSAWTGRTTRRGKAPCRSGCGGARWAYSASPDSRPAATTTSRCRACAARTEAARVLTRPATPHDWPAIWPFFRDIVADGESYTYPDDITPGEAEADWMGHEHVFVVEDDDRRVVASAVLGPNKPGRGAHVANASFM